MALWISLIIVTCVLTQDTGNQKTDRSMSDRYWSYLQNGGHPNSAVANANGAVVAHVWFTPFISMGLLHTCSAVFLNSIEVNGESCAFRIVT